MNRHGPTSWLAIHLLADLDHPETGQMTGVGVPSQLLPSSVRGGCKQSPTQKVAVYILPRTVIMNNLSQTFHTSLK